MKSLTTRKPPKDKRERLLLVGLIDIYLETGKPVGSNTLRENGFESLSSATIRNYFSKLEEEGFLKQQHSSGGRIPTALAYQLYAEEHIKTTALNERESQKIKKTLNKETRELATYMQMAAEAISISTGCAAFLSSPRFDQDFVMEVKLVSIDSHRCLCVLMTDFGLVHTEILYTHQKLSNFALKRLENFFHWKLTGLDKPELSEDEETLANRLYGEVMLRHLVKTSHFTSEDIIKTGFSKMLTLSDFHDASLGIFENKEALQSLLHESCKKEHLSCWVGGLLQSCSAIAAPYTINHNIVGAIGVLGPHRIPYKKIFGILTVSAQAISESLTRSLYKFRISYREPDLKGSPYHLLLENKHE
jgi:heat-inducible transcriptional repressor